MAESLDSIHLQNSLDAPKASGGAREQRLRLKKEKEHTRVRMKDCNRNLLWGEHADAQLFPVSSGSPRRTPEQGSRKQTNAMPEQIEISKYAYGASPQHDEMGRVTRLTPFQNFFGFGWKAASKSESKLFWAENLADFAAAFPAVPLGDVFLADRAELVAHLPYFFHPVSVCSTFERIFFLEFSCLFFFSFKWKNGQADDEEMGGLGGQHC